MLVLSGAVPAGTNRCWAEQGDAGEASASRKLRRLQELGFGSPDKLPKLEGSDLGRCLLGNPSAQAEVEDLNRKRDSLATAIQQIIDESRDLKELSSTLSAEESELALVAKGLKARSGELAARRSAIENSRPKAPVAASAANRFNAQIDAFNADVKRLDIERSQLNARIPSFNEKLEQYNLRASVLNERIEALQISLHAFDTAVGQANEKHRFFDDKCRGKRVINLGS